jgi:rhodanese-related sulfurtransferase
MRKTFMLPVLAVVASACAAPGTGERPPPGAAAPIPAGATSAALPPSGAVDAATARRLVAAGVTVVDVRTPEEFASGHVPGAVNIPHDQMAARHGEIGPPATPVLLYCRSGRRSGIAAGTLAEQGFTAVWDMRTYDAWVASAPAAGSAGH